jgi:hypothetical protein
MKIAAERASRTTVNEGDLSLHDYSTFSNSKLFPTMKRIEISIFENHSQSLAL